MKDCLDVNRVALSSMVTQQSFVPKRLGLPYEPSHKHDDDVPDWTLIKAASFTEHDETVQMGVKVVSVRSHNPAHNLPLVPATVLNIDPATGKVDAVLAGTYLTAARTAAGSALATAILKPHLQHLVVFGAGLQAELHIQAIATALNRPIPLVTIVNRTEARSKELSKKLPAEWAEHTHTVVLNDSLAVSEAISTADCIATTTNSPTPIFDGSLLKPGCHINGIGSYTPDMQEVAARTVDRCRVFMDTPEAKDVGDLKHLTSHHPIHLLGELLIDPSIQDSWEASPMVDSTFYKSVGTCIQDVMTAKMVVKRARELNIGTMVDMS
jgi:ornithine cyclodeaminase